MEMDIELNYQKEFDYTFTVLHYLVTYYICSPMYTVYYALAIGVQNLLFIGYISIFTCHPYSIFPLLSNAEITKNVLINTGMISLTGI